MAEKEPQNQPTPVERHDSDEQEGDEETYPEGGLRAWLVVLGAWLSLLSALGIMNTLATLQTYVSTHQLQNESQGTIGWVFSVYTFVVFFLGVYIGPVFDKYGPKWLQANGGLLLFASLMILSMCTALWHFILTFGFLTGLACSLLFTPSFAVIGHHFSKRRGLATGIASTGGSIGGIIIPLMLESLFEKVGWTWAIRCLALMALICCGVANFLVQSRLEPLKDASVHPDLGMFFRRENRAFLFATLGFFMMEFALFIPLTYVTSYARHQGFSESFSYQILPILNAASFVGRAGAGWVADRFGPYNTNLFMLLVSVIACLGIWLPSSETIFVAPGREGSSAGGPTAALVIFAILTGIATGANVSITPVCIGRLCKTQSYGRYYATCYTVVAFACLVGVPIAGEVLAADGGSYWGMAVVAGVVYMASFAALYAARADKIGWKLLAVY